MFEPLEPQASYTGALPSTVLHSLLIAAAIAASRAVPNVVGPVPDPIVIDWPVQPTSHSVADPVVSGTPAPRGVDLVKVSIDLPEVPPIGIPPTDPRTLVFADTVWGDSFESVSIPTASVLFESEVDDPPSLLAAGPLRYPPVLREAGITGSVTLSFIIDIDGRVEADGIEVVNATHPGFVAAATETVRASRFLGATSHGHPVRVRVRQTVTFKN